jgi:CheY-like chemotaxis protein
MRILVAEDDLDISSLYKKALERRDHNVVLTSSGDTCIQNYVDNLPSISKLSKSFATTAETSFKMDFSSPQSKINSKSIPAGKAAPPFSLEPSYDAVILDYAMPGM